MCYFLSILTHTVQTNAGWHGALSWQCTQGEAQMKSEGKIRTQVLVKATLSRIVGKIAMLLGLGTSLSGTMPSGTKPSKAF